jgi:ubiquinone/menaquinone biosynthesis C-methylase UbiE
MPGNNPIQRFMARQLRMPSGWFGVTIVSRIMNRVNKSLINSTIELLQIEPHLRVLEIGFGGGTALSQIAARLRTGAVCGVDISPDLVHKAERRFRKEIAEGRVRVMSGGISQLPFSDNVFDRVFTINTIYFWPDPLQGMREICRVLRDEGRAIVSLRSKETMQNYAVTNYDFHLYLPEDAATLMREAGFRNVQVELRHEGTLTNEVLVIGTK